MAKNITGKKKQIVLMISKKFLAYHTKKGLPTDFEAKIKSKDKLNIEAYLKMVDTNVVNRLFTIIKSDFQLFNSRFRLMMKLIVRPYINN